MDRRRCPGDRTPDRGLVRARGRAARDPGAPRGTDRVRRRAGPAEHGHYGTVLALLVAGYLASALAASTWVGVLTLLVYASALVLAIRAARLPGTQAWTLRIALAAGSVATLAVLVAGSTNGVRGAASLWVALVLAATIVLVVRHVLRHPVVTLQTIAGALSAYLLIGLMFAEVYTAMSRLDGRPFFAGGQLPDSATVQYFSFTTLTTLGYGDFTAAHDAARAVAVLEALLGQIFLVTLIARLVSNFGAVGRRAGDRDEEPDRDEGSRSADSSARGDVTATGAHEHRVYVPPAGPSRHPPPDGREHPGGTRR
jgi:hypothetical protein